MKHLTAIITSAIVALAAVGDLPPAFGPHHAVAAAALDAGSLGPVEAPHYRYYWAIDQAEEFHDAFAYALNTAASHSPNLYQPERLADGRLIRVDLRRIAPQADDYVRLVAILEGLAGVDPYFHTQGKRKVAPYKASDGKTYDFVVGTDLALHTDLQHHLLLTTLTGSAAPILRADWFMVKMLSVLDGGLYYKLRGIEAKPAKGTAEQAFHASLGVDLKAAANLRSDERLAILESQVTFHPRVIEFLYGTNLRPSVGPSLLTITRDHNDGPIDGKRHVFKNLLNYRADGSEQIGTLPNGLPVYALFDADGNLVDSAPGNLVSDRTRLHGTTTLEPAGSCIRCHASEEGWKSARNDIALLTSGNFALDIFDDESSDVDPQDTIDRLRGLYSGDLEIPLRVARTVHAKATFELTGGAEPADVCGFIGKLLNDYAGRVTPRIACLEAGYVVSDEMAVETYNAICPPLPPNSLGVSPESLMLGVLRKWTPEHPIGVPRGDWEQEFADFALRVRTASNEREAVK